LLAANRARLSVDFDFTPMYPEWRMQTFAKDQALDVARLGTDGHSNADLSRPLTDRERQNAVQADPTEKKPEHSGVTQRRTRQLHGHEDVRDHAGHRHLLTVRQIEGRANLFQGLCYGFFYASILGASAILCELVSSGHDSAAFRRRGVALAKSRDWRAESRRRSC